MTAVAEPRLAQPPRRRPPVTGHEPRPQARGHRRPGLVRYLAELMGLAGVVLVVAVVVKTFLVQPFYIPSPSMVPQLLVNDRVVVSKLAYDLHGPHRGDIVVFVAPPSEQPAGAAGSPSQGVAAAAQAVEGVFGVRPDHVDFIKRVIALPGEVVQGAGGHVYVNGRLLVEPYLPKGTFTSSFPPTVVPAGHLWVMGDNRGDSSDSRVFGPIPTSSVVGRAFARFWPLGRLAFL